jgi:DNA-binding CsgD family transcriptional regulator
MCAYVPIIELCEECDARRLGRMARAELGAASGRRRQRGDDPDQLTAQEARVAALAAQGMPNPQIAAILHVSARTVEHHLARIYRKLGIRSRRELIRRRS